MAKKQLSPEEIHTQKKTEVFEEATNKAKEDGMHFIQDVIAFMSISKSTFYEWFPAESEEMETLKQLLNKNKIQTKIEIRQKLAKGDKAAELIALYKLLATPDERDALSMQRIDHTSKGKEIKSSSGIDYSKLSMETLLDLQKNTIEEGDEESE